MRLAEMVAPVVMGIFLIVAFVFILWILTCNGGNTMTATDQQLKTAQEELSEILWLISRVTNRDERAFFENQRRKVEARITALQEEKH